MIYSEFQPIVRLVDNQIVGYEALARKKVGDKIIPTLHWLPDYIAAPGGSLKLTEIMFAQVVNAIGSLPSEMFITINVEAKDFHQGPWQDILARTGILDYKDQIIIEISERGPVHENAVSLAENARQLGFRLALDDVGAGTARLFDVVDLAPDVLKLDIEIIPRLGNERMQILVRGMCDIIRQLGGVTLIEGIETESQAHDCLNLGVELGQGFFYGKPGPLTV